MTLPSTTIVGNLVDEPTLRFTNSGVAMCNFTVAAGERKKNERTGEWEDGDTTFLRCTAWRALAENIAESCVKGSSVIVTGRIRQSNVEKDGDKRTYFNVDADQVGLNLSRGPARQERRSDTEKVSSAKDDPWSASDVPF